MVQLNVRNGWRCSTAVGYLKPNLKRKNLKLMTRTQVRRILFEGKRAVGVEVEEGGAIKRIRARREVIVSGGSINSPSAAAALGRRAGRRTAASSASRSRHDLPGVGKNLQDHVQARFTFLTRHPGR